MKNGLSLLSPFSKNAQQTSDNTALRCSGFIMGAARAGRGGGGASDDQFRLGRRKVLHRPCVLLAAVNVGWNDKRSHRCAAMISRRPEGGGSHLFW